MLQNLLFSEIEEHVETNIVINDNSSCVYRNTEPNVATFHDDTLIIDDVSEYPSGTVLVLHDNNIILPAYRHCGILTS